MKRPSELKADIDKIKKLRTLQQQATEKLNKIGDKAAAKAPAKKKAPVKKTAAKKPAAKPKIKAAPRKKSFWQRLFGGDKGTKS